MVEEDKKITAVDKEAHVERLVGSTTRYLNDSSNNARRVGRVKQEVVGDEE